jgi:hypothetical protein
MKIAVVPFMIGSVIASVIIGSWGFTISAAVVFVILLATKQVKLF